MAAPWEKFQPAQPDPVQEGPWTKFQPIEVEPTSAPLPKWDDIKGQIPDDMQSTHGDKIKNALSISATYDIPPSQAYSLHDKFTEKFKEKSLWDKAQGSFKAGIGDVYSITGSTMKWLGASDESANVYLDFGERLRSAYIPSSDTSEFTWGKMKDPEWWATTGARAVPFTLSLIPAAIVGAYGGAAVAGAVGFGAFGTTILGAIGGAALSRPVESAFEAGGAYEEAIARGMTEEEADKAANSVFKGNMALTGVDAAQFALAFTPLRVLGKSASKALSLRILATTGKLGAVGLSESAEERYQETISGKALGDEVSFFDLKDPRLNEASALGLIFGVGMGGAGSVWTGLKSRVVDTMPPEVKAEYDAQIAEGKTDAQALDAVAAMPEGKEHIESVVEELKKASENITRPEAVPVEAEPVLEAEALTPEEEALTIETDEATDRAMFELSMEGVELEAMTDEMVQAKIESFEQASVSPVAETGIPEAGVEGEARATSSLDSETGKRIITDEMYQGTLKQWKEKTSGKLFSGVDPTTIAPLVMMGAYHIESGIRTFSKWSEQMIKDFGEKVKPHLKDIWKQSQDYLKAKAPKGVKGQVRRATGLQTAVKMIREDEALSAAWKKAEQSARIAFRAGNKEGVAEAKTAMKETLRKAKAKEAERNQIAKDIKTLKKLKEKSKGTIAVEYQEAIKQILEGIDFAKPTDDTILRLTALHDHILQNGVPLGISQSELNELGRLSQVSVRDLAPDALSKLAETVRKLYDLGKLKAELLAKKEGREQQKALDDLIASTKSLDPSQSGKEEPTRGDIVKYGLAAQNIDIQHTYRVADSIDGVKDYSGANALMIKEEMQAEITAKNEGNRRSRSLVEGIQSIMQKAGIDEITEDMQARITINMLVNQGARSQAIVLMEKYNFAVVPALDATELQIAALAVQSAGEKTDEITSLYQKRENLAFPEVQNYFPIKYVNEDISIPVPTMIMQDRYRTKQAEQGFTVSRTPGVQKVPRIDFLAVAEEAINAQEWYINIQPVLDIHAALIRTPEFKLAAGQLASNWWKDQIDIVARRGWSASAKSNPMFRMARMNINQAVLGYKLTTVLMQPFAVFDAMAYATSRWGLEAGKDILVGFGGSWVNPQAAMAYVRANPALNLRQAGEIAIEETMEDIKGKKGAYTAYKKYAMSGIRVTDILTAAGVQKGFLNILEKQGITGAEAEAEAEFLMNLTNGSSEVTARPHVLARGEGARMWLTFQSFFLNRWGILTHDLIKSGYSGNWSRKATALMGLAIMMAGGLAEDKTRELLGLLMGGKEDTEGFWKKVFLFVPRQLPAIGGLFEKWGKAEPPLIQTIGKGAKGISQIGAGKPIAGIESLAESILAVGFGVPGTIQGFDLLDAAVLDDIKKSESKKKKGSPYQ